jgi:hypothetical protein
MDKKQKKLEKLLGELNFLVGEAKRGLPPCVYGTINKIDRCYTNIKKYIKNTYRKSS